MTTGTGPAADKGGRHLPEVNASESQFECRCGPVQFSSSGTALYDRHLAFDKVIDVDIASARDRFEALAHSVRDILAQRWLSTERTYVRQNCKRV